MTVIGQIVKKPVHRLHSADPSLIVPTAKVGIEIELEGWDEQGVAEKYWEFKEDGSLRNHGIEFVTLGGLVGEDISRAVSDLCVEAKKRKFDVGYPRAGIHVHLDCTDLDVDGDQLASLVCHYALVEHALFAFSGQWRRECGYCVPYSFSETDFPILAQMIWSKCPNHSFSNAHFQALSKYQALNLKPLNHLGTVEFRHLPTTFDASRIMNWINLVLSIKDVAQRYDANQIMKNISLYGALDYIEGAFDPRALRILRQHLDVTEIWKAVDTITSLLGHGELLKQTKEKQYEKSSWNTLFEDKGPNPLLERKSKMLEKYRKSRKPGETSTPPEEY